MSGRFPNFRNTAASKESSKKTEKQSAGRKPSMERPHSSRAGTSSLPASPMDGRRLPTVPKKTSTTPGKKDVSVRPKVPKTEAEKTSEKSVKEHRSRTPSPSNKTTEVEGGGLRKPSPVKFQPVATRPVLSPRSRRVQESAKKFLNLKKTENFEQRGMEEYINKQFPILRNKLDFVGALSKKVENLIKSSPDDEEKIRQENASLNRFIYQAAGAFRDFENMLLDTKGMVVEHMKRAEDAQRQLDDALRTVVNDICNYSNPDFLPADHQQRREDDSGEGTSGYKPGDQGSSGDKSGDQGKGGSSGGQDGDNSGHKGEASGGKDGDKSGEVPGNEGVDDAPGGSGKDEKPVDNSEYHIQKSTAPFPGINLIDQPYITSLGLEDEYEYEWESEYDRYPQFNRIDNFFKESMRDACGILGGFKDTVEDANTLKDEEACKKLLDGFRTVMTLLHGLKDILQLHNDTGEIRSFGYMVDKIKDGKLPEKDSLEMKTVNWLGHVMVQMRDLMNSPDFPDGHKQCSYEGIRHLGNKARQCLKNGIDAIGKDLELD